MLQKLLTYHLPAYFIYFPLSVFSHYLHCLLDPPRVPRCLTCKQQGPQDPGDPTGWVGSLLHVITRRAGVQRVRHTWAAGAHGTLPGCGPAWAPAQGPADLFSWPHLTLLFCSCLSSVPESCSPVSRMPTPLGWGRTITVNVSCIYFSVDVNSLQDSI